MNTKDNPIWILVADRARARLFELLPGSEPIAEIESFINPDGRGDEHDRVTDRLPRVNESSTSARHAIEPHTSLREKSADRFARQLHDALEKGRVAHRYQRLVLIALPQFLGTLHGVLSKQVRQFVVAEIPHELSTRRADEIQAYLPRVLFAKERLR